MPRFVILTHDWPFPHYDLMLAAGDTLRTWRLPGPPTDGLAVVAEPLGNHRLGYLDYEGPVSGDRGRVKRWDWGIIEWRRDDAETIEVRIEGVRLDGIIRLIRQPDETWTCCFEKQS